MRRKTVALASDADRADRRFLSRTTHPRRRELAPIYSNRSASFLRLSKVSQALSDAERCIELRPDWDKAYFRKATALEAQNDDDAALVQFEVRQPFFRAPGAAEAPRSRRFSFRVLRFFR
jgi:tetratricopeptide (TPR) repeat protein